jgi:NADH:ubiquinone oxidoreductase subunit H
MLVIFVFPPALVWYERKYLAALQGEPGPDGKT